jgi:hypothetical protein
VRSLLVRALRIGGTVLGSTRFWLLSLALLVPRCSCDEPLTTIEETPDARAEEPGIRLDAGSEDAGHVDGGEADAADGGIDIDELCDSLPQQTLMQSFTFTDVGPCPWGQGDNLPLEGASGWSARTEQVEIVNAPSDAIICGASFQIPQTDMWFDDAMVIALQNVVLMTDVNVAVLATDGAFHLYDWNAVRGSGGSHLYCLSECMLPAMETPGPMSLAISADLARSIGARAASQGAYEVRVVTIGDNDPGDCRHQPFDFVVTLDYVIP